jgi:hypothetical protein
MRLMRLIKEAREEVARRGESASFCLAEDWLEHVQVLRWRPVGARF